MPEPSTLLLFAAACAALFAIPGPAVVYLVLLGIQALRRSGRPAASTAPIPPGDGRLYRDGVLVNVLNPKVAVFFVAFLPQFIDPGAGAVAVQILVLGTVYAAVALLLDGIWALVAAGVGSRLRPGRRLDRLSAGVYFALGAAAALTGERPRR